MPDTTADNVAEYTHLLYQLRDIERAIQRDEDIQPLVASLTIAIEQSHCTRAQYIELGIQVGKLQALIAQRGTNVARRYSSIALLPLVEALEDRAPSPVWDL